MDVILLKKVLTLEVHTILRNVVGDGPDFVCTIDETEFRIPRKHCRCITESTTATTIKPGPARQAAPLADETPKVDSTNETLGRLSLGMDLLEGVGESLESIRSRRNNIFL